MAETTPMLVAALAYARMGLPVFPCAPGRKSPITTRGFYDATTDEAQIRRWWAQSPRANIGMPTGEPSGLIVLDIDPRNGGDESMADLEARHGAFPDTPQGLTGGGGRHLFVVMPAGHVPCTTIAPGIDLKGDGGYVVLPPSVHPSGTPYSWELSADIADVLPVPAPAWLVALVRQGADRPPHGPTSPNDGPTGEIPSANVIPEGQRNGTLARLGGVMRRSGMSQEEILAALLVTNRARCRPPLPDAEVERVAASIARYEPDAVSVALVEDHYEQMFAPAHEASSSEPNPDDPGPIPDELLRVPGFIGELMDCSLATAPYPNLAMSFCGALAMQALLAGRKVRDPGDNRTNIYLLGLAHSASGKDWPRKVNAKLLHEIDMVDCLADRFASGEGIQDALFTTPSMLFQFDEIDGMLQSLTKSKDARYESILGTLLTMHSSAASVFPMRRKAGKETPGVIDQPNLVVLGTAIPTHYYGALSERLLTNGFFARTIVVESGKRSPGQDPTICELPPRVIETGKWWAQYRPGTGNLLNWHPKPAVVEYAPDAADMLADAREQVDGEYQKAEASNDPVGTTVWGRVTEHIRKLALIYAVSENCRNPRITDSAVRWATSFMKHQTRRMLFMASVHVAETPFDALCQKVIQKIRAEPEQWIAHQVLLKRMKIDAKNFRELMSTLIERGDVLSDPRPTPGRTGMFYGLPPGRSSDDARCWRE